jgi:class 3 adenylate cyclase/tetratricopeptide (TPR) repeat protein
MAFFDLVHSAIEILEREGRVSHHALKRHLEINDEMLGDLVAEIVCTRQAAVDLNGEFLVWNPSAPGATSQLGMLAKDGQTAANVPGERRQLTIMFVDLVGSSELSGRVDPEDLRDILRSYQDATSRAIARLGGYIDAYLGDGIIVYFGYPTAGDDVAVRAVRSALAVQDAVCALNRKLAKDYQISLQVRIGVHTGLVVLAEVGEGQLRRSTALGEVPNIAARLQQVAGPNQIVASDVTERLVRGFFELEPLGRQSLKGIEKPVSAFRVTAARDVETRFDVGLMGNFTAFVGRKAERLRLEQAWDAVRHGDRRAVLVVGESGIGKSRLVQMIRDRITDEGGQYMKCRCSPNHQNTAYFPISDLVARQLGLRPSDSLEDRIDKLRAGLANLALDDAKDVARIASILSLRLPPDLYPPSAAPSQRRKLENLETLQKAVQRIAQQAPLVLVVEDIHWIDPTSAEFFSQLRIPGVLLIMTSRRESDLSWVSGLDATVIELERLSRSEARQLIEHVGGARLLPQELVEELLAKTEGIPLFIEEQTKAVLESEIMVVRDGAYELTRPLREMRIAETLQDSLRVRLDRLDGESRHVAQLASTLGRSFPRELLEAVASTTSAGLHNAVTRLLEAGMLLQSGDCEHTAYFFRHELVREVAYQSLLKSTRRDYHMVCAEALVAGFPEIEHTQPELIARHFRLAGDTVRAIKYYELAGQDAARHWALHESIDHLQQAISLLQGLPDDSERRQRELELLFALGPALMSTLGYANKAVEETYRRIRELCDSAGLQAKMFPALVGLWQHNMVGGSLREASVLGAELLRIAESVASPTFRLIAMRSLGTTLFLLGDFRGALEHTSAGWKMYDIEKHGSLAATHGNDQGVAHGVYFAWTLWTMGRPDSARAQAQAAIELAYRLKHPMSIAFSQSYAAMVANLSGEFALAQRLAMAAREVADEHGLALWSAHARTQIAWARIGLGDVTGGVASMDDGIAAWFKTGAGAGGSLLHAVVAEAHLAAGDAASAEPRLAEATATIAKTGERFYEPEIYRLRGELACRTDADSDTGREWFMRGIELARAQGARSWELRLCNSLASHRMGDSRNDSARTLLSNCVRGFDEGFDTRDLATAKRLLAKLG